MDLTVRMKVAEENLVQYNEVDGMSAAQLFAYNVATGALNADGSPTGEGVIKI